MRHALKGLGIQPCVRTLAGYASECAQVEERRFERRADHPNRRRLRAPVVVFAGGEKKAIHWMVLARSNGRRSRGLKAPRFRAANAPAEDRSSTVANTFVPVPARSLNPQVLTHTLAATPWRGQNESRIQRRWRCRLLP